MRLFVGLPFSHQARRDFLLVQRRLERNALKGNFTAAGNFHLTLAFLGEVEEQRLPAAFEALEAAPMGPFELTFSHLGTFDRGIWYLAPDPCPPLTEGQARLAQALRERGFWLEDQVYVPHLTLGRKVVFREGYAPRFPLRQPIPARSEGAQLFLSHRVEGELRYEVLSL